MKLGEKIYSCRKKSGLSQEALAEKLGVSRQAVSKWETGDAAPDIANLLALAKTLGVTTDWLLSDDADGGSTGGTDSSGGNGDADNADSADDAGTPDNDDTSDNNNAGAGGADNSSRTHTSNGGVRGHRFDGYSRTWVDAVPGVIGRMLRRFGWIGGVIMMIWGAALTAIGAFVRYLSASMVESFTEVETWVTDTAGNIIGGGTTVFPDGIVTPSASEMFAFNPAAMMGGAVMIVGAVIFVAGLVLTVLLLRLRSKNK